jgi:hypothetical protein
MSAQPENPFQFVDEIAAFLKNREVRKTVYSAPGFFIEQEFKSGTWIDRYHFFLAPQVPKTSEKELTDFADSLVIPFSSNDKSIHTRTSRSPIDEEYLAIPQKIYLKTIEGGANLVLEKVALPVVRDLRGNLTDPPKLQDGFTADLSVQAILKFWPHKSLADCAYMVQTGRVSELKLPYGLNLKWDSIPRSYFEQQTNPKVRRLGLPNPR